ncbi:hypothetical protein [Thiocapsa marina]|uniref:Translation initiation factor IF-2 n=1 Tax=Thiocapsa marina 5811 TaxID=768671 RepID=F9U902_9GAMM|nr:hypothetical protein [Thiocapsa marina]EGV19260.1 translation initiation factor IF-2 [Thiocapsa marina 5811]
MPDTSRMIPLVSAATLALVIGQGAFADPQASESSQPPVAPANEAPAAPAPVAAPADVPADASTDASTDAPKPGEVARAKAEERRAAMMAEREKRYEELRARAAEIGLALPEMPPWESVDLPQMPEPPAMPERHGMSAEDMDAMREQRRVMREQMRSMTPEERRAMRDAHWQQMRADAAERGVEMPETPPWAAAEERRKEMEERFEAYRKTVEAMSEEQIEAARALFGSTPEMPEMPRMPPHGGYEPQGYGYGYGPQGGYPGGMPYPAERRGMGYPPVMPDYGTPGYGVPGYDQGALPQGMGY